MLFFTVISLSSWNDVRRVLTGLGLLLTFSGSPEFAEAQEDRIPHNQSAPPNDPYSAADAAKRMTVPDGFAVDVVACEPDLVNPVAMAIDERGRFWVCESIEYPRSEPGVGRDRIRILEDTDGDGKIDLVKTFAEGLNIPSGIALGRGGVWVANSPDLLLLKDTDGDDVADQQEVVVTGFGRDDTHELPNSLVWGPDGWLYGLNGVFNRSRIEHQGEVHEFTCAMFRIDPVTRRFELFAEGTSNPWGIAWNEQGEAFLSACVIDHLWHLSEGGYYHRQAGAYPPGTWKIESIVDYRHQQAAYCGIHFFDSPAYPAEYRNRLMMGNIHGNCINVDSIAPHGATYRGSKQTDIMQANDAWFMPVAQQTGPDGSLYVLDWYDRYHCYQDARRDPEGIDRLKGRLYRLRYGAPLTDYRVDWSQASVQELLDGLGNENGFVRATCRRLLIDRTDAAEEIAEGLRARVADNSGTYSVQARREALWTSISRGSVSNDARLAELASDDPVIRAWSVRDSGNRNDSDSASKVLALADDADPSVRLQVAIAAAKFLKHEIVPADQTLAAMLNVLQQAPDDGLTARLVFSHLRPLLSKYALEFSVAAQGTWDWPTDHPGKEALDRANAWLLELPAAEPEALATSIAGMQAAGADAATLQAALDRLFDRWSETDDAQLQERWSSVLGPLARSIAQSHPELTEVGLIGAALNRDRSAIEKLLAIASNGQRSSVDRMRVLRVIAGASTEQAASWALAWLNEHSADETSEFRAGVLPWIGALPDERLAQPLAAAWSRWPEGERASLVETLSGRRAWGTELIRAVEAGTIPSSAINSNQVRKLIAVADDELRERIREVWGTLREGRDPAREKVIAAVRDQLAWGPGDPLQGRVVFDRVCAACHRLHGTGVEVGPDLTANGRGSFEQLLSNVLDPSLVIGAAYQATLVETDDGRVVAGLVIEESPQKLVLRTQGDVIVELSSDQIADRRQSELSLMPENLETSTTPEELRDLFALLLLDGAVDAQSTLHLAGSVETYAGTTDRPERMNAFLNWVVPGFRCDQVGEGGMELLPYYNGRRTAVRVHPISEEEPCRLFAELTVPAGQQVIWKLPLSHDEQGNWRAIVRVDQEVVADESIGAETVTDGWQELSIDLSRWSGKKVRVEIDCTASGWSWEFAYLGRARWEVTE